MKICVFRAWRMSGVIRDGLRLNVLMEFGFTNEKHVRLY